jgi:hypothetical protein
MSLSPLKNIRKNIGKHRDVAFSKGLLDVHVGG